MGLSTIEEAVNALQQGKLVVVVDDEDRENEGDLIMAAEMATPATIAFMIRYTSGIICVPCEEDRLRALELPQMVDQNSDPMRTAFTISVDCVSGMTTGVSAQERANTIRALADDQVGAKAFVSPGHVFPLRYRQGGVLVRSGHTEAAIDLCRLAGLKPMGVLSELTQDDGTMMRLPECKAFAQEHGLPIISIESLIKHRANHEVLVSNLVSETVQLLGHELQVRIYTTGFDEKRITVVVKSDESGIDGEQPTLVRIVRGVANRDFFSSALVPGNVIHRALQLIAEAQQGVFIYLPPDQGQQLPKEEQTGDIWREVGVGSHILSSLGVRKIHLLASKELSFPGISSFGLEVETIIKEL